MCSGNQNYGCLIQRVKIKRQNKKTGLNKSLYSRETEILKNNPLNMCSQIFGICCLSCFKPCHQKGEKKKIKIEQKIEETNLVSKTHFSPCSMPADLIIECNDIN